MIHENALAEVYAAEKGRPLTGLARLGPGVEVRFDLVPYCPGSGVLVRESDGAMMQFCACQAFVDVLTGTRVTQPAIFRRLQLAGPGAEIAVFGQALS